MKKHMCATERCQGHELDEDSNFFLYFGHKGCGVVGILGDHDDSKRPSCSDFTVGLEMI